MLIPSDLFELLGAESSLSRRVNANSQPLQSNVLFERKLIKKGEC